MIENNKLVIEVPKEVLTVYERIKKEGYEGSLSEFINEVLTFWEANVEYVQLQEQFTYFDRFAIGLSLAATIIVIVYLLYHFFALGLSLAAIIIVFSIIFWGDKI